MVGELEKAKLFPRNEKEAIKEIKAACKDEMVAINSSYLFVYDGQIVEGPSIRLAELLAQKWGNIEHGVEGMRQTPQGVVCSVYAIDLEKNVKVTGEVTVPILRWDAVKVYEKIAGAASRRKRGAILSVLPSYLKDEAERICGETLKNVVKKKSDEAERKLLELSSAIEDGRLDVNKEVFDGLSTVQVWKLYQAFEDGAI